MTLVQAATAFGNARTSGAQEKETDCKCVISHTRSAAPTAKRSASIKNLSLEVAVDSRGTKRYLAPSRVHSRTNHSRINRHCSVPTTAGEKSWVAETGSGRAGNESPSPGLSPQQGLSLPFPGKYTPATSIEKLSVQRSAPQSTSKSEFYLCCPAPAPGKGEGFQLDFLSAPGFLATAC